MIDPFGYCGCGPDITDALSRFLNRASKWYDNLTLSEKSSACSGIYLTGKSLPEKISSASSGWDIFELAYKKIKHKKCKFTSCCDKTVTVSGRCYDQGNVNYVLWGFMNSKCNGTFSQPITILGIPIGTASPYSLVRALVSQFGWKFVVKYILGGNKDAINDIPESAGWTIAGYNGGLRPESTHKDCNTCSEKWIGDLHFRIRGADGKDIINEYNSQRP